jgi:hypothetical protein
MLAYPASSGSFPKISCFALRGCRHARSYIRTISRVSEVSLPTSHSLRNTPSALVVLNVTNKQGVIANELINDGNETIDSTANVGAIYVGY